MTTTGTGARDPWCGLAHADRAAVAAFARANGRTWKRKLLIEWERACVRMRQEQAGPLIRARTALGPSKLLRLRPADLDVTIGRAELARLAFVNSGRLPQVVNDGGRRTRWVGIGWVDEGAARGDEVRVADEGTS
jgi:hypothetical protein